MTGRKRTRLNVEGRVARLTLSHSPVNALSSEFVDEIETAIEAIQAPGTCSVLHLQSSERVFCAGGDLKFIRSAMSSPEAASRMRQYVSRLQSALDRLANLPAVSVCEISGAAMGGGLELALACDIRIASKRARLGLPEVGLGLLPAAGGTQRLTRLVGLSNARRLILRNQILSAEEARSIGLVDEVFEREECPGRTEDLIQDLASKPRASLVSAKKCILKAGAPEEEGYRMELDEVSNLVNDPEAAQRVSEFLNQSK